MSGIQPADAFTDSAPPLSQQQYLKGGTSLAKTAEGLDAFPEDRGRVLEDERSLSGAAPLRPARVAGGEELREPRAEERSQNRRAPPRTRLEERDRRRRTEAEAADRIGALQVQG